MSGIDIAVRSVACKALTVGSTIAVAALTSLWLSQAANATTPIPFSPNWDVEEQDGLTPGATPDGFFSTSWLATTNETVLVTGLYVLGNNYNIYDNNVLVATTNAADWSATGNQPYGAPYTLDPNAAWATTGSFAFAHASFSATAGDVITIQVTTLPSTFTDSAVAVSAAVPELPTWAMLIGGFLGLGALHRVAGRSIARAAASRRTA